MLTVHAEKRIKKGKSYSRNLRLYEKFPAILYGFHEKNSSQSSILLTLDHNSVFNLQKKTEFYKESLFLFIKSKEKKYTVKVQSIQWHVFKKKILHMDFLLL